MPPREPIPLTATELVERWLAKHLRAPRSAENATYSATEADLTRLPSTPLADLFDAVRTVLASRPALGQAARRLSAYEQFRLTLELARAATPVATSRLASGERFRVKAARRSPACTRRRHRRRAVEP
jgi:hypothetical protein